MATAVQTAGRFRPGLGLGEAEIDLLKVVLPLLRGTGGHLGPGQLNIIGKVFRRHLLHREIGLLIGHLHAVEEGVS